MSVESELSVNHSSLVERSRGAEFLRPSPLLILPLAGWFLWFLLIPLSFVLVYSFATRGPYGTTLFHLNVENYLRATHLVYLKIFWNSLKLALITSASCLLVGFPMAYTMATASKKIRAMLLMLVVIPFWTNFVVRTYALKVLLAEHGPVNQAALYFGLLQEPFVFANSGFAIWLGMLINYLPFMVMPLYVALEKFDFSLMEAAKDLGASSWRGFWEVLLPLIRPGMVAGLIFVFTPALGEFVIPDLLGGAKTLLLGNVITDQFLKTRDWPFGAALSLLLLVIVMVSLFLYIRAASEESSR
jgi:spermidine/putrescine transport system permease protein